MAHCNSGGSNFDCNDDRNLVLNDLCAKCGKICRLKSKKIWAEEIIANDICAQDVMSASAEIEDLAVNNFCAVSANINELCVTTLKANSVQSCNVDRAYVGFTGNFPAYVLGTPIPFNNIVDNPAGLASFGPAKFTVGKTGYWAFSAFVSAENLSGTVLITGIPVAKLSVIVNGLSRKSLLTSFLSFNTSVQTAIAADLFLNAGDIVSLQFDILIQDPLAGVVPYVGTMTLVGGPFPATADPSSMDIYFVSSLCTGSGQEPVTCVPCERVENGCSVVNIDGCRD